MTANDLIHRNRLFVSPAVAISGFWRRTTAFVMDVALLSVVGVAIARLGFDWLASIGAWGRLIGFALGSAYFTCLEGVNGRSQSLGKRVMKIKVMNIASDGLIPLTPLQAWCRYAIIAVPLVLGGICFVDRPEVNDPTSWLAVTNMVVVFLWLTMICYLLIMNRPSRQSLQDIFLPPLVVRADSTTKVYVPLRRFRWGMVAVNVSLLIAGLIFISHSMQKTLPELSGIEHAVLDVPGVQQSAMFSFPCVGATRPCPITVISAVVATSELQTQAGARRIVRAAFVALPELVSRASVVVLTSRKADLGIAIWREQTVQVVTDEPREDPQGQLPRWPHQM